VDRDALKYLINKLQLSGHISQWVILLQEFMFKVLVQLRKNHVNADHLSKLNIKLTRTPINVFLLDAAVFVWEFFNGEYANFLNFLSLHQFPSGLSKKEKRRLIQKTIPYTIIGGIL
jgi:hypothetical protein